MKAQDPEPTVAAAGRVYDYLLGGTHNYAVDREAAAEMVRAFPLVAVGARYNREFLGRVVRHLTAAGIRQFLDLGSGIPTVGNVHEIAPDANVVYVDHEPEAVRMGNEILAGNPRAATIQADLRDPAKVLDAPEVARLLDFREPVGLLLVSVLHFVTDQAEAEGVVRGYLAPLAPGSHLALSHLTHAEGRTLERQQESSLVYNSTVSENLAVRSRAEIEALFAGTELVEPGLVPPPDWRPEDPDYLADPDDVVRQIALGGVGLLIDR